MKKIKMILLSLVCVLAMCPFLAGCSSAASYVKNSFNCNYKLNTVISTFLDLDYRFDIKTPEKGTYSVTFEIEIYENSVTVDNWIQTEKITETFTSSAKQTKTISGNIFRTLNSSSETPNLKFAVNNMKITRKTQSDSSSFVGYAIGFGVTGGVLLCGTTAFFIIDKLLLSKKRKDD